MGELRDKIRTSLARFEQQGTERLTTAREKATRAILSAVEKGDRVLTMQDLPLSPGERTAFEAWLGAEGIEAKLVYDQRDGDFYHLTIR